MASSLRLFTLSFVLLLSTFNHIEARTAQNEGDNETETNQIKRQIPNYRFDAQRNPQTSPQQMNYDNQKIDADEAAQSSGCRGCGPRRDCQCPGKGAMGITGPQGFPGIPGDRGIKGPLGRPGKPGFVGEKGDRGQYGNKGERGDDGLLPIDGQNGFPGQAGAVGPRGIPGVPGCNGSKVE